MTGRSTNKIGPGVLAAALALLPAAAGAQSPGQLLTATSGLVLPNPSAAASDDLLAVEQNPAGLIGVQGTEATFVFADGTAGVPNDGAGLFFGLPLGGFWVPAVAVQWLDGTIPVDRAARKTTLSSAFGSRSLAVGVSWISFSSGQRNLDGLSSWDVGLLGRPWSWLSLAAVARNASMAELGGLKLPVVWDLGLALRPLTWRVTLHGDVLLADERGGRGDLLQELRFGLRLHPARSLFVQASLGLNDRGPTSAGFSLGFSQETLSLEGAAIRQADDGFDHLYSWLRADLHTAHRPPLLSPLRRKAVELALAGDFPELKGGGLLAGPGASFSDLLATLRRMRGDARVGTLLLQLGDLDLSLAQVEELRQALSDLRQQGVRVLVHLGEAGNRGYYLACAADEITMAPGSSLSLLGISATFTYLHEALEKLHVRPEFVRLGRYKSAPNTFTADRMDADEQEMEQSLLDNVYGHLIDGIARARHRSADEVRKLVDGGPYLAEGARDAGLIDGVAHYPEMRKKLQQQGLRFLEDYAGETRWHPDWSTPPRLAVVHVSGIITEGESNEVPLLGSRVAGADSIAEALDQAAEDAGVKAIVLRVDSPGGSATASEMIHFHVAEAAKKKPVVVSLGAVAASGGYYVAAPGTVIYADPSTITGSIGIFSGKFDVSGLLGWLGVNRTTLKRGERADLYSADRPFTDAEREAVRGQLQQAYDLFVRRVADGRHLTVAQVQEVAQGRVWTGEQAKERKLVDELGGLEQALSEARRRSNLSPDEEVELLSRPRQGGLGIGIHLSAAQEQQDTAQALLQGLTVGREATATGGLKRLLTGLGWLPAALVGLRSGEPLALMESVVELR